MNRLHLAALRALAFPLALVWTLAIMAGRALANAAEYAIERQHLAPGVVDKLPLQPFTNVVATGLAISDLRHLFGYTIDRLTLRLSGGALTKAMLTTIQLKANGKVIWDSSGSRTDSRQLFRGIAGNAAFLVIDFTEIRLKTKLGMTAGGIDTTRGIKDLRLEVQITGATTPALDGWAEVSLPQVSPEYKNLRPLISRIHSLTQTIGAAGTFAIVVPHMDPNAGGSIFKRINVFSANMTGARLERNGIREWDVNVAAFNNFNQAEYLRTPQAGLFCLDFILDGLMEDRILDTRPASNTTTAQLFGTFSAGETITVESEVMEPLDVY